MLFASSNNSCCPRCQSHACCSSVWLQATFVASASAFVHDQQRKLNTNETTQELSMTIAPGQSARQLLTPNYRTTLICCSELVCQRTRPGQAKTCRGACANCSLLYALAGRIYEQMRCETALCSSISASTSRVSSLPSRTTTSPLMIDRSTCSQLSHILQGSFRAAASAHATSCYVAIDAWLGRRREGSHILLCAHQLHHCFTMCSRARAGRAAPGLRPGSRI